VLLNRPRWTREAFDLLAREHRLPLDGVCERDEQGQLEQLDVPMFENGKPLVLTSEAIEKG
jgi:hypothetical protein